MSMSCSRMMKVAKKVWNTPCDHPDKNTKNVTIHTNGFLYAAKGQRLRVGRCWPGSVSDAVAGGFFMNMRDRIPMPITSTPKTNQVCCQPCIGSRSVNQGTSKPDTTNATLPPAEAKPAATPRFPASNQGDNSPIIGVRAAPLPNPVIIMASIAVQKLSEAASNSIAPPAAKVLTPTIIRLPYRGAKVPAAKELTFRTTHATVIKVPICV